MAPTADDSLTIVLCGPGGVGKGTVVDRLLAAEPRLVLSRSWTTRAPRPGESGDAYVFVDRAGFMARVRDGGFLEWAEFAGNLYGTPVPEATAGSDLLLEIDVQGAEQVLRLVPDAVLVLLEAPSREVQAERLRGRGDPPERVAERLALADAERAKALALGATEVVNDDLDETVGRLRSLLAAIRADAP